MTNSFRVSKCALVLVVALLVAGGFFLSGCQKKVDAPAAGAVVAQQEKAEPAAEQESDKKEANFALISPDAPVFVDKKNTVTLEIQPRNGLKINHDFPWKVKFLSKNNLQVQENELSKDQIDMNDKRVKFTIDVTPTDQGTLDLEGVGTFSVCSKKLCDIRRNEPLRFTLVSEPEA